MKRSRDKLLYLAGAALIAVAPAASQQAPESLLPPGFGNTNTLPPPQPAPQQPQQEAPGAQQAAPGGPSTAAAGESTAIVENSADQDLESLTGLEAPSAPEMPDWARRSTAVVGAIGPGNWGLAENAFGRSHGVFLSTLMRRLDAPIPSRWASIFLRRTLLSRVPAPYGVNPVDWVAERAWLLLRMGEADAARMLVQAVDVDQFTPKMFAIAVQTALANADPAGLCPLVRPGRAVSDEQVWPLADAMCAALAGDPARASALIDDARRHGGTEGIDLALAEKVVGAGENTRRAVTIEWDPVDSLNSWRFGLASATGLEIPDRLLDAAGPRVRAWQARAPMVPLEERLASADVAASLGVFSNPSLVDIYSEIADNTDPADLSGSTADRLHLAYAADSLDGRVQALRQLWDDARTATQRNARLVLTAAAAARIPPSDELASDAPRLIAAMLTAGLDRQAARWSHVVAGMDGADGDKAWSQLALGSPQPSVDLGAGRIRDFSKRDSSDDQVRAKLLVAGLAGLGRISDSERNSLAGNLGLDLAKRNRWTVMIDAAAERRQAGTVVLLAAVGMQTADWRGVPPEYLFHIVRALRTVGLEYEARMIAAEAMGRL
ncbi:MAG: hypothetical protein ACM3YM_07160 [Sphingomonadales bacterium]